LGLEGVVLKQRAQELRSAADKLARQRAFLREERRRARMDEELIRQEKRELDFVKRKDWVPIAYLPGPGVRRVRLNVGGQIFEASETVLQRDPGSLLAALCDDKSPLSADRDGTVYLDRDWWIFRYVLKFLRDGILPDDRMLLQQVYSEASYWACDSLKYAIEEQLHLFRSKIEVDKQGLPRRKSREDKVW
ncbi:unnamed protein product, partial [Choristocarpus tenellus]